MSHAEEISKEPRFELIALRTCGGGLGCNEFVFERVDGGQV